MPGIGLLHRVHGEGADSVNAELVNIACIFYIFRLIGNFWQSYGKSHSLKQPPTDKPTLKPRFVGQTTLFVKMPASKEGFRQNLRQKIKARHPDQPEKEAEENWA
jgi:hypothetical protein